MLGYQLIEWYFIFYFLNNLNFSLLFIMIHMFSLFYYLLIDDNLLVRILFILLEDFTSLSSGFISIFLVVSFIFRLLIVLSKCSVKIYLKD